MVLRLAQFLKALFEIDSIVSGRVTEIRYGQSSNAFLSIWVTVYFFPLLSVTVSGKKEVVSVQLSEEVVDPEDIEMLQDLIVAATNEALRAAEEDSAAAMAKLSGGLGGLGGGFPF